MKEKISVKNILLFLSIIYPIAMATSMAMMEMLSVTWVFFGIIYLIVYWKKIDFKNEFKNFYKSPELPIVLFVIWGALVTIPRNDLSGPLLDHLGPLRIFMLYFCARFTLKNIGHIILTQKVLFWVSGIVLIYALIQHITGLDLLKPKSHLIPSDFGFGMRAQGVFNNPLTFANAYLMFVVIGFAFLLFCWKEHSTRNKILLLGYLALGIVGVSLSLCRYLIYALPIGFLAIVFLKKYKIALTILMTGVLVFVGSYLLTDNVRNKVAEMLDRNLPSNYGRVMLLEAYKQMVTDNFVFGVGLNNEEKIRPYITKLEEQHKRQLIGGHSHNHFLQILAETGIVGLVLFIWFNYVWLIALVKYFYKSSDARSKAIFAGSIGVFIVFHLAGLTQNTFGDSEVLYGFFYLMGRSVLRD